MQLAWALRARIRDGRLGSGQRLPGLRDLAEALKINANTVRAVYQRLEHEGIIESLRGSGTFVAATAQPQRSVAGEIAANAAREALRTGVDPREVAAALYVQPGVAKRDDGQVERRQRLRMQIAALEQALAEIEVAHPGARAGGPRIAARTRSAAAGRRGARAGPDRSHSQTRHDPDRDRRVQARGRRRRARRSVPRSPPKVPAAAPSAASARGPRRGPLPPGPDGEAAQRPGLREIHTYTVLRTGPSLKLTSNASGTCLTGARGTSLR